MSRRFTLYVLVAMILGILAGFAVNATVEDADSVKSIAGYLSLATDIFLRLIKMIIGPLVFSTLVAGIAHMGGSGGVARPHRPAHAGLVPQRLAALAAARHRDGRRCCSRAPR